MSDTLTTYIDTDAGPLFAAFDRPARGPSPAAPVLVCPPWGWTEMASYRSRRDWARHLAGAGHPVLRFDLPGTGNSPGSHADPGLCAAWIGAIGGAVRWLRGHCGDAAEVCALGLGLGGLLALEAIESGAAIDAAVLWATPASGSSFVRETRAFSRMQLWGAEEAGGSPLPQGWIEAAGFVLSAETAEELKACDPAGSKAPMSLQRALVLGRETTGPSEALIARLGRGGVEVDVADGVGWDVMTLNPEHSLPSEPVMAAVDGWLRAAGVGTVVAEAPAPRALGRRAADFAAEGTSIRESVVEFPIAAGKGFGVLCEPAEARAAAPLGVFLNAAADRHIGPNRIWVTAARDLAALGARTVRVDLEGIGESDGDATRFRDESEFYEPGLRPQLTAILDHLEAAGHGTKFVIVGVSSGGYWAFHLALTDRRVRGSVILNPSVFIWHPTLILERWGHDFRVLMRRDLWVRLLRGEFTPHKLARMAKLLVRRCRDAFTRRLRRAAGDAAPRDEGRPVEPELAAAFDSLRASGTEVSIGFIGNEPSRREIIGTLDQLDRWPNLRLTELPGVSHSLAPTSAQLVARRLLRDQFERLKDDGGAV